MTETPLVLSAVACFLKRASRRALPIRFGWPAFLLLLMLLKPLDADDSTSDSTKQPVDYMIVITGGELLAGAYADGHTHFLTRTFRPLGLRCVGSMSVDDKENDINAALRFASGKAPLIIVTGGLGPTDNDITRETLSEYTGIALREHHDVLEAMKRRFKVPRDKIRSNLRRQTRVPTRGTYLKNANGTAVGLVFEQTDSVIVALPGPPRELQTMVQEELVPYLSRRFGTRLPGCSLTLRFVGLGQSQVDQTLKDHVPLPADITLASQFEGGRVDFTFSLPDDTPEDRARLNDLKQKISQHLGDYLYAFDGTSLEQHVVSLLEKRGATLALAEVGSGGSLAAGITDTDGADAVLAVAYVAPTEDRLRRLLCVPDDKWKNALANDEKTRRLAAAAAESTTSEWTVAVGDVRQGANSERYVEVVLRLPDGGLESQRIGLRGTGQYARSRLTTRLLDLLRRRLK
ncbi:MAG: CinA family protein [Planctomycetes bacterium]|nr:CinA family protein [Planctomycetota bacterium]MBL7039588.1 CinA family protein [Pirellulaceae bacterium]